MASVRTVLVVSWLSVFTLAAVLAPRPAATTFTEGPSDVRTFRTVVNAMAQGAPYYPTMGAALRRDEYPTGSVFNWRPPLVYLALARVPSHAEWMFVPLMLSLLFVAGPTLSDAGRLTMGVGLMNVLAVLAGTSAALLTESWAGIAVAVSLACHLRGWRRSAIVLAGLACALRELAVLYLVICTIAAWKEHRRDELRALAGVTIVVALYYSAHWWFVRQAQLPTDAVGLSWLSWGGMAFLRDTLYHTYLGERVRVPLVWAIGLSTLATAMPQRLRWTIWTYACAFLVVGRSDNAYWGLVMNPTHALALGFLPDVISRSLARHAHR